MDKNRQKKKKKKKRVCEENFTHNLENEFNIQHQIVINKMTCKEDMNSKQICSMRIVR